MIVFPVRHHSPAGALRLAESLRAARPRLVLVEGPCDATPLIPLLLASDTRPPAAILAYLPADALAESEAPRSSTWPFCAYSPEYVALRVGREVGAELRFFDMPAGAFLDAPQTPDAPEETPSDVWRAIAARFGFDDYEEFWECRFEMSTGDLREALLELGLLVRAGGRDARDAAREAWMRAEIARALAEGYGLDEMFIVCGAAHAPALTPPFIPPENGGDGGGARSAKLTLVPFSYPRLSEQLGYGAGNRAPAYYQMVWEHGGDFARATQEALIRTADALHRAGYAVSLADAIEANRLACTLAALRDKPAPGLYEVRNAAQACYGRGAPSASGCSGQRRAARAVRAKATPACIAR
ncbi:MAG: DUF5682 family protein [Anaerolineae bacterium]|nr:DUF5682 family protein [Anaerolineae bacterium]